MVTERRFTGKRLPLTIAFTILLVAAFGAGCKGFFQPNALQSIAIQPSSVNILVNGTQVFSAWGTYQDGTRQQITSGVVWTTSDSTIVELTDATGTGEAPGSATITGSAQGLSGTATVNVIGNVTSLTVSPISQSMTEGTPYPFTFTGSPGPPTYITTGNGGTLTVTAGGTGGTGDFSCVVGTDAKGNPAELCTAISGAVGGNPWSIEMSYPTPSGGTVTATATANASGN